jgi:hypothetical protein
MTRAMVERFRKFVNEQLKDPQHKPLREILTNSLETKVRFLQQQQQHAVI